jgi:hypothetical protein
LGKELPLKTGGYKLLEFSVLSHVARDLTSLVRTSWYLIKVRTV